MEVAAAAAAAEQAEAAARKVFLQDWAAAVAAVGQQRPHSVVEQQRQWLSGPHADRVQALLVRGGGTDTHWGRKQHPEPCSQHNTEAPRESWVWVSRLIWEECTYCGL